MSNSETRVPTVDRSPIRAVMERLFVLMRTIAVHGETHPLTVQTAQTLGESLAASSPPFALQFVRQAVFRDCQLVMLDPNNFQRAQRVAAVLEQMKVNELAVEFVPEVQGLIALGRALHQVPDEAPHIDGIRLRKIQNTTGGNEGEQVDPSVFAVAQMTRAVVDAERLVGSVSSVWGWSLGVAVTRRLERALDAADSVCLSFVEVAPGALLTPRRAVTATLHALAATRAVGLTAATQRATAHAALAVALHGISAREGVSFVEAVERTVPSLHAGISGARLGSDPHRARVCAIVHSAKLHAGAPSSWHPTTRLVQAVYEMERLRCPRSVTFDLKTTDLLAALAEAPNEEADPAWVAALMAALGVIPPGVRVRTADGALGVVMGEGVAGDPSRPRVYVDGRTVDTDRPVTLALRGGDVRRTRSG